MYHDVMIQRLLTLSQYDKESVVKRPHKDDNTILSNFLADNFLGMIHNLNTVLFNMSLVRECDDHDDA